MRVVWWLEGGDWSLRVVETLDGGATWTIRTAVPIEPLGTTPRRLEVVTLDRGISPIALHDVYLDGALVIESAVTTSVGDDSRSLVVDGSARARFDRVSVSYARMEDVYRYPPFVAWTAAPVTGDTVRIQPTTLVWVAEDEKWTDGIATQRIELSIDGGHTWELVAELDGAARTVDWLPPVPATAVTAALRLVVEDDEGDTRTRTSEPFILSPDVIAVRDSVNAGSDDLEAPEPDLGLSISNLPAGQASPALEIRFSLPRRSPVRLRVIDVQGRLVRRLTDRSHLSQGTHGVRWDLRDEGGAPVATGVYFCRLDAGGRRAVRKIQVVR
jgi:hypothetical protein